MASCGFCDTHTEEECANCGAPVCCPDDNPDCAMWADERVSDHFSCDAGSIVCFSCQGEVEDGDEEED